MNEDAALDKKIEAVLFYKTEPVKKAFLCDFFTIDEEALEAALEALEVRLASGATRVSATDSKVQLVTASELSEVVTALQKNELQKSIGKAGAETLAIILYRGPVSRADIDRVRGVNSAFIVRNLLVRGLIERSPHPKHKLSYLYNTAPALLNHLGIQKREELPEFEEIMNALDEFEKQEQELENESAETVETGQHEHNT